MKNYDEELQYKCIEDYNTTAHIYLVQLRWRQLNVQMYIINISKSINSEKQTGVDVHATRLRMYKYSDLP